MKYASFWDTLQQPIIALAPMDGVTDAPCRTMHGLYGRPDVAQIFGCQPEYFDKAAHVVCELGFDGLDINMGCPAKTVANHGGGAALIRMPETAKEIIRAAQQGVQDWANGQTLEDLDMD